MIDPLVRVNDPDPILERALSNVQRRVRFRRAAQYITFNNDHPNAIIAMQPVYQDPRLSPRIISKIAVFEENDTLAQFILEQGAK